VIKTSEQVDKLYAALSAAQSAFKTIPKDKEVKKSGVSKTGKPFNYSYFYSAYETIIEHIRKPMAENGLGYIQSIIKNEQGGHAGYCVTRITHASGQFYETTFPLTFKEDDMQQFGGVSTYGKRYGLTNAIGLATDDDMDGNELRNEEFEKQDRGQHKQPEAPRYAPPTTKTPDIVEKPLIDQISDLARVKSVTNMQLKEFISKMGKKKSAECTEEELMTIFNWLKMK